MPALFQGAPAEILPGTPLDEYVEIGLLLPKNRATALMDLARLRRETVGQILRRLVDDALAAESIS